MKFRYVFIMRFHWYTYMIVIEIVVEPRVFYANYTLCKLYCILSNIVYLLYKDSIVMQFIHIIQYIYIR